MSSAAQILRQAEALKASVSDTCKTISETWVARQKLEDLYKKVLLIDLEYALDKKAEQDLWNHAFKNQINNLQTQAKDKQNPKKAEVQATLNLFLETASGVYLQFLQLLCTTFKLDLPFRRKSSCYGILKEKNFLKLKITPPKKSSCLYICQHCLVHLGDIARYRQQIEQAQTYYWHAANLVPSNGQPYNQLAILEAAKGNKLSTVFYYIRSLAVKVPFPVAATNLEKLYSKLAKDTPEFKGKLSVSEMITGFLQFHALIHLCTDQLKAAELSEKLAAGLPAHVTSQSFPSQVLVQIVAINVFAMNHARQQEVDGNTDNESHDLDEFGSEEEKSFNLVFSLTVSMLDILLQYTPKQEHKVKEYFTLPAVKLLLDWFKLYPENLKKAPLKTSQLWSNLCKVLNNIQNVTVKEGTDPSKYDDLPLPEDADLRCFQPLEKAHSGYSFSKVPNEGLLPDVETSIRCQRLLAHGQWIAEGGFNLLNISTTKQGKLQFSAPSATVQHVKFSPVVDSVILSPEKRSLRQNVAIQAIIQKQAQASDDLDKGDKQLQANPTSPKYLLGVPTTEPQFMKAGGAPRQITPVGQQGVNKATPSTQPQMILLQNQEHASQRQQPKTQTSPLQKAQQPQVQQQGRSQVQIQGQGQSPLQPPQQPQNQRSWQKQKLVQGEQQQLPPKTLWSPNQVSPQPQAQPSTQQFPPRPNQPQASQFPWQSPQGTPPNQQTLNQYPSWQLPQGQQQMFIRDANIRPNPTGHNQNNAGQQQQQRQQPMPNPQQLGNRFMAPAGMAPFQMRAPGLSQMFPKNPVQGQTRLPGQQRPIQSQMSSQLQPPINNQQRPQGFGPQQKSPLEPSSQQQRPSVSDRFPVPNIGGDGGSVSMTTGQLHFGPPMFRPPMTNQMPPNFGGSQQDPMASGPNGPRQNMPPTTQSQSVGNFPHMPPFLGNQLLGTQNNFPPSQGKEIKPTDSRSPQHQQQQQQQQKQPQMQQNLQQKNQQQQPPFPYLMQQGQFMNPFQSILGLGGLGLNQQKGAGGAGDRMYGNPNMQFPQSTEEISPSMAEIIGTLSKLAIQPPRSSGDNILPQQRTPASFQGHAEGTPKPDLFFQPPKGNSTVPAVNIDLDTKEIEGPVKSAGVPPSSSHQHQQQQGTYTLFSNSPWLASGDSKSKSGLGSSPFSSASSSIRNSPDPSSDFYNPMDSKRNSELDIGLMFGSPEDQWGNKLQPTISEANTAGFFPASGHSIWSSSHAQSPLERLLELQKQQRPAEPH
ncbi:hypothetical protein ACJMK2_039762 [Sinanodonta woodiana]|uniref:Protein SMG7 n=1 Tax=Sinanodonta woodiana TaxID=1069815 RepID=A0ABD3WDX6_SINWO